MSVKTVMPPPKTTVQELAKELGVPNKSVIEKAAELGIKDIKSYASGLTAGQIDRLRAKFGDAINLKAKLDENISRLANNGKTAVKTVAAEIPSADAGNDAAEKKSTGPKLPLFGVVTPAPGQSLIIVPLSLSSEVVPAANTPITSKPKTEFRFGVVKPAQKVESASSKQASRMWEMLSDPNAQKPEMVAAATKVVTAPKVIVEQSSAAKPEAQWNHEVKTQSPAVSNSAPAIPSTTSTPVAAVAPATNMKAHYVEKAAQIDPEVAKKKALERELFEKNKRKNRKKNKIGSGGRQESVVAASGEPEAQAPRAKNKHASAHAKQDQLDSSPSDQTPTPAQAETVNAWRKFLRHLGL